MEQFFLFLKSFYLMQQYMHLLMAGGTERYDVALERFDLDASQAAFWSLGLDMVSDMIDELESLT